LQPGVGSTVCLSSSQLPSELDELQHSNAIIRLSSSSAPHRQLQGPAFHPILQDFWNRSRALQRLLANAEKLVMATADPAERRIDVRSRKPACCTNADRTLLSTVILFYQPVDDVLSDTNYTTLNCTVLVCAPRLAPG
jgi:hypothetical protein